MAALPLQSCSLLVSTDYGCTQNSDCYSAKGNYFVCKRSADQTTGTCVDLTSADCPMVYGDWQNDQAFIIGSVLPTTGKDQSTGLACEDAIRLAIDEFAQVGGLPGTTSSDSRMRRPIVLVGCSDQSAADVGIRAARHLAEEVGVPAIIGAQWSGVTREIAQKVTIHDGVLLISPTATAVTITGLADDGLVWRTSPSDEMQGSAMASYVPLLEQQVRTARGLAADAKIKVSILYQENDYGNSFLRVLNSALVVNGVSAVAPSNASYYHPRSYGAPENPDTAVVADTVAFKPDIVVVLGTNEGVTKVLEPIEKNWSLNAARPRWVLGDGGQIQELWTDIGTNDDLRKRTTGTVPGSRGDLFSNFQSLYLAKNFRDGTSPAVFGPAGSYDSVYLLAYSAVSLGGLPVTGSNLAYGFSKLVPAQNAQRVAVGLDSINHAFQLLQAGTPIDFTGASGPLDFDLTVGEARSDIQIWCMPKDPATGKAIAAINSGLYLDVTESPYAMKGSLSPDCR